MRELGGAGEVSNPNKLGYNTYNNGHMWWFPKMEVPPNHPFEKDFPL